MISNSSYGVHNRPGNSHMGMTQRCWENIRKGIMRCRQNPDDLSACIRKCQNSINKGNFVHVTWLEILNGGRLHRVDEILATENFFDLPADQMRFWENHVQNHPFAALFAPERLQRLRELRAAK